MAKKYDLIIIGGGSAAFAAATKANDLKVKTLLINSGPIGGTCVNVGCVPSKHLLEVGNHMYYAQHHHFSSFKFNKPSFSFKKAIDEKRRLVSSMRTSNYAKVLKSLTNVSFVKGKAQFISKNRVNVGKDVFEGKKFVIATGSHPFIPPIKGIDKVNYLTNVEALELNSLPKSMVIIGGGALGCEFAQMYSHFGTKVTILQRNERLLPPFEPEVGNELGSLFQQEGINVVTQAEVYEVQKRGRSINVLYTLKGKKKSITAEKLLIATGRKPNTQELGVKSADVNLDKRGFLKTNRFLKTTNSRIYGAGDCATPFMLETLAAKMGATAAENALKNAKKSINYKEIPFAVFTNPQVAMVGYSEAEFTKKYKTCSCRTLLMSMVPKAQAVKDTRGLIKMMIHPKTERIVGVQIISPLAADLIHEATLAVKFKLTLSDLIETTHVFPTMSESIKKVAHSFKRDVSLMSCCIE